MPDKAIKISEVSFYHITMSYEDFQYDSCTARGICSINPRTSALQGVLLIYLKFISKYALNLNKKGIVDNNIKNLILNTIALAVANPEFTEGSFTAIVSVFKEELPKIIEKYNDICDEVDFEDESLNSLELFKQTEDIISAIKFGEKQVLKNIQNISPQILDMYKIMFVIAKSISINLMDLESFQEDEEKNTDLEGFIAILKLLETISIEEQDIEVLKSKIFEAVKTDNKLMKNLREAQEARYGKQRPAEVSYTTVPSKAVLVAGSNIRELETVLEALKDSNIDVYTHDDMMLAHTFPKFAEYHSLKGQYGHGMENCLLDFATFPGAIVLTKHSLHNIENLYRGRLFTTDFTCPKGVIRIENNDFSEVIKSSDEAKGFKRGKQCETVTIGYNHEETMNLIDSKLQNGEYSQIFLIGLEGYSLEQKAYFEKIIKLAPKDVLIISFSYSFEGENFIHVNTCFDTYAMIKIFDEIKSYNLPIAVFVPKCDRNSISEMIYLVNNENTKVFVGKCTPILLNPSLMSTLQEVFNINGITTSKNDITALTKNE